MTVELATLLFFPGIGCLLAGLVPWQDKTRMTLVIVGVILLAGSFLMSNKTQPTPTPNPNPSPLPVPTEFGKAVIQSFTGTKTEALLLAALSDQFARQLMWDANRNPPRVSTVKQIKESWQEAQRWRVLDEQQWGTKFAPVAALVGEQLRMAGVTEDSRQVTPEIRSAASSVLMQFAAALAQAGT